MDLNHIGLTPSLVADMYQNHLVNSGPPMVPVVSGRGKEDTIQHLGKNQKGICLLVSYPDDVHLPDTALQFLRSILQACKLDLGDVAIINCYRQKIEFAGLQARFACKILLAFGTPLTSIGLPEQAFFTILPAGGCSILYAPAAEVLNNNQAEGKLLKSRLWNCLKQLFGV